MTPEQEQIKREKLIQKFLTKKQRLSYSTLKNFTSPINLINYKLKPYKKNSGMLFGSVCDVLALTPQDFDREFFIAKKLPSEGNQIVFADAIISIGKTGEVTPEILEQEYNKAYKTGTYHKVYHGDEKTIGLEDYIDAVIRGKEVITQDIKDEAEIIVENLKNQKEVDDIFMELESVQKKLEWTDGGWKFLGFLDMYLDGHIIDLKFTKDANPDKFEKDINNLKYYLQSAMYCYAIKLLGIHDNPKYSILAYDKAGNYSLIEIDYGYIQYGIKEYKWLLQELNKCVEQNAFDQSYGFFKKYTAYKPKWAKGFQLDEEPDTFEQ